MKSRMFVKLSMSLAVIVVLTAVVGCGATAAPTPTVAEQVPVAATPTETPPQEPVVVAQAEEALVLNPLLPTSVMAASIQDHIFDSLVSMDSQGGLTPALAESWETSEDGLTWTFHIRKGIKTSRGTDFKAEQAKLALDMIRASDAKKFFYAAVDSVTVVDEYTLQLTAKSVFPVLPIYLSVASEMFDAAYFQEVGEEEFAKRPIGTGPYTVAEWVPGDRIVLEARDDYWAGAPAIKTVVFKTVPESSTRIAELLTSELDLISGVPVVDIERVNASPDAEIVSTPGTGVWFIRFNTEMEPLDDVRVRQAMNYAVDVQAIIDNVLLGYAEKLQGIVPSHAFGYLPDVVWPYQYDPDKARELLSEAGYPDGFSVKFDVAGNLSGDRRESIDVLVGQLAAVGIKVEMVVHEPAVYTEKRSNHELDALSMDSLGGPTFDAGIMYEQFFHSKSYKAYWHPPEVEALIEKGGSTVDEETRLDCYRELAEILAREAPMIPMYVSEDIYGRSKRLNWVPRTDGFIRMFGASVSP